MANATPFSSDERQVVLPPVGAGNRNSITFAAAPSSQRSRSGSRLPRARGPLTEHLLGHLVWGPHEVAEVELTTSWVLHDEDAMLALYLLYELHYRGFEGVADGWEWEPSLLRVRAHIEAAFERNIRHSMRHDDRSAVEPDGIPDALRRLSASDGPSLSRWFETDGMLEAMREFAVHRSLYQRKEADPHTFLIPRLDGPAKVALVEIQYDEYGSGELAAMHAELFAGTMRALDLDPAYGAYLDVVPAVTLATTNLVSMFGLHRRWRGAGIGHLALFEMCSVMPMGRYAAALHRLGVPNAAPFYDAHVIADERHQVIACDAMAGALARDEPELAPDILFGAQALHAVEESFTRHLLGSWSAGRSSLRTC
jgi:hypothetical protein